MISRFIDSFMGALLFSWLGSCVFTLAPAALQTDLAWFMRFHSCSCCSSNHSSNAYEKLSGCVSRIACDMASS